MSNFKHWQKLFYGDRLQPQKTASGKEMTQPITQIYHNSSTQHSTDTDQIHELVDKKFI